MSSESCMPEPLRFNKSLTVIPGANHDRPVIVAMTKQDAHNLLDVLSVAHDGQYVDAADFINKLDQFLKQEE